MSYFGMRKEFKDFPTGEWIMAAGRCECWGDEYADSCDASVEVKIEKEGYMLIRCLKGHETDGLVGWEVGKEPVSLGRLGNFFPILKRADHSYCASCGRIIVDIPLILWGPNAPRRVDWEIDFCFACAERLGVLNWLNPKTGPATTQVSLSRKYAKAER
jgi:hypothetical protein